MPVKVAACQVPKTTIDVTPFDAGVYTLSIKSSGSVINHKLVIVH